MKLLQILFISILHVHISFGEYVGLETYSVDISSGTTSYRSILGECVNKVQGTFYSVNTGGPEEASFVRYSLTERQKDQKIDWIELEGQYDIFKCDEMARLGGAYMFLSANQTCKISKNVVYTRLDEYVDPEGTTTVYIMDEALSDGSCPLSSLVTLLNDNSMNVTSCGMNQTIFCRNGLVLVDDDYVETVLHPVPGGCAFYGENLKQFTEFESDGCSNGDFRGSLCAPATEEQREQFVQLLFDYFDAYAFVGLQWNSSHWEWTTGVKQPETAGENGWAPNMPDVSSTDLCVAIAPKGISGSKGGLTLRNCQDQYYACCLMTE